MPQQTRHERTAGRGGKYAYPQLFLFLLVVAFVGINARWLWAFRRGQPLDIDEAGYLSIALADYYGLIHGGLVGWITAVETSSVQAPLTTALSSLVFYAVGPHIIAGFSIPLLCGVAIVIATYHLGKALGSTSIGVISSLLVATAPGIVEYSRSFHFALPATAVMTVAMLALLRSERFTRVGWSSIFGLCVGLLPLARTMAIAFLPGLLLAAVLYAIPGAERKRTWLFLAWSLFLAVATALLWLGPNAAGMFNYLLNFGYGARAAEFGSESSLLQWNDWLNTVRTLLGFIYLPHFLIVLAAAGASLIVSLRVLRRHKWKLTLRLVLESRLLPILVCVVEAVAALTSSRNKGSAFVAPIVPALITAAVYFLYLLSSSARSRRVVVVTAGVVAIVAGVPLIDLNWPIARPFAFNLPVFGRSPLTDGRGSIQKYEAAAGFDSGRSAIPIDYHSGRAWVELSKQAATLIDRHGGSKLTVAFGFRHYIFNVNTVNMQQLLTKAQQFHLRQIEPFVTGAGTSGYLTWLATGDAAQACLLLTAAGDKNQFAPAIVSSEMQAAAKEAGFEPVERWSMPNGEGTTLWKRSASPCQ
jgi:hypothetical protein